MARRYSITALRLFLAVLFLFSGVSKALNPYGFSIKAMEYAAAMGMEPVPFMQLVLGIGIPALEISLGLLLVLRIMPRGVSVAVVCLMSAFTALTLWDLVADLVGDCGCFGDVVKLSPLASFLKNVVILVLSVWYLLLRDSGPQLPKTVQLAILIAVLLCPVAFPAYVYRHLPLYDVSGYVPGVQVGETAMAGAEPVVLLYRNRTSGDVCPFTLEDTQWQDSTAWEFVGIREDEASGKQFPLLRDDFTDVSSDVLSTDDSLLFVVVQNPETMPDMSGTGLRTVAVSAYDLSGLEVEHYGCDFSLLRQIMPNSDGGALLVHGGVILGKWAMCDCPYLIRK